MRLSVIRSLRTKASTPMDDARKRADRVARAGVRASALLRSERAGLRTPAWFCLPGDLIGHVLAENGVECGARSVFELGAGDCKRIRTALASAHNQLSESWLDVLREEAFLLSPHASSTLSLAQVSAPVCKVWCSAVVEPFDDQSQVGHLERLVLEHAQSLVVNPLSQRSLVSDPGFISNLSSAVLQVASSFFEEGLQAALRSCTGLGFPPPRVWFSIVIQREEEARASGICWSRDPHVADFFRRRRVVFTEPLLSGAHSTSVRPEAGPSGFMWSVGAESEEALDLQPAMNLEGGTAGFSSALVNIEKSEALEWERMCRSMESEGASSVRITWIRSAVTEQLLVVNVEDLVELPPVPVQDELCRAARQPEPEEAEWVEVTDGASLAEVDPFEGSLLARRVDHHLELCQGATCAKRKLQSHRFSKRFASVAPAEAGVGLLAPEETQGAGQLALIGGRVFQRVAADQVIKSRSHGLRTWWATAQVLLNAFLSRAASGHRHVALAPAADTLRGCLRELDFNAYKLAQLDRRAALARRSARWLEQTLDRMADRAGMGSAERGSLRVFDELALGTQRRSQWPGWTWKRRGVDVFALPPAFPLAELWIVCERFYAGEISGRNDLEQCERQEGRLTWHMLQSCNAELARAINRALSRDRFFTNRSPNLEKIAEEFWSILLYLKASRRGCLIRSLDAGCEAPETVRQRLPSLKRVAAGWCRRLLLLIADREADLRSAVEGFRRSGVNQVQDLGRRLCAVSEIDDPDDVHHLTLDDLERFVDGRILTPTLRELVLLRKRARTRQRLSADRLADAPGPIKLRTWGPVALGWRGQEQEILRMWGQRLPPVAQEASLSSESAVPGLVRGRVVVDAVGLNPAACLGRVLVSRQIDDLWLARVAVASALVLESDGRRSSALAVARALRIPTLVGVRGVLSELVEGDEVLVDAVQGRVQFVSRPAGREGWVGAALQGTLGQNDAITNEDCVEEPSWESISGSEPPMAQDFNKQVRLN